MIDPLFDRMLRQEERMDELVGEFTKDAPAGVAALARLLRAGLLANDEQRLRTMFLGGEDARAGLHFIGELRAQLQLAALNPFIRSMGGHPVFGAHFECNHWRDPDYRHVRVDGVVHQSLYVGTLYFACPNLRVVCCVSADPREQLRGIRVSTNGDTEQFYAQWKEYARQHNYLRGRMITADGEILDQDCRRAWADIVLPPAVRSALAVHVEGFFNHRAKLKACGAKGRRGIILAGPPGTGKTLLCKVLASSVTATTLWVQPSHVKTVDAIDDVMRSARFLAPTLLILEDLDLLGEDRDSRPSAILGQLMNQLDGANENDGIATIATTNRLDVVENALRNRPGRFDRVLHIGPPEAGGRQRLLKRLLHNVAVRPEDLQYMVEHSDGLTGAQIEELVNTLYFHAVQQENEPHEGHNGVPLVLTISRPAITSALDEVAGRKKTGMGFQAA